MNNIFGVTDGKIVARVRAWLPVWIQSDGQISFDAGRCIAMLFWCPLGALGTTSWDTRLSPSAPPNIHLPQAEGSLREKKCI